MKREQFKTIVKYILKEISLPHDIDEPWGHEKIKKISRINIDDFTKSYIVTALWSSTTGTDLSGGEPMDKNYDIDDIEEHTFNQMVRDCKDFQSKYRKLYERGGWSDEQAGHDFWLTRNGHGAGFWDRKWNKESEEIGKQLTKAAHAYGEFNLFLGAGAYDGLIVGS